MEPIGAGDAVINPIIDPMPDPDKSKKPDVDNPYPGHKKPGRYDGDMNEDYAGDNIIWDQRGTREFFEECNKRYQYYSEVSDKLRKALTDFVNDDNHTGAEADAAKEFVACKLYLAVDEVEKAVKTLSEMMGCGASSKNSLPDAFISELDEHEEAYVSSARLEQIVEDFKNYSSLVKNVDDSIQKWHDKAEEIFRKCKAIKIKSLKRPDSKRPIGCLNDFVSEDGNSGLVPKFKAEYEAFIAKHSDDFSKSEYKETLDKVNKLLDEILSTPKDPVEPTPTPTPVNPKPVPEKPSQGDVDKYDRYNYGCNPGGQAYRYDPVNMNSGNFVSSETDLRIGGCHILEASRFYNAKSDKIGVLGRGWTFDYEEHLTRNGDSFVVYYDDGREEEFTKKYIGDEEIFVGIHGEAGTIRDLEDVYRLSYDDNRYIDFDMDGYIVAFGDNYGKHTFIEYDLFEKEIDGDVIRKALPVKVSNKEGSILSFAYDKSGLLVEVKDHAGRNVSYKYEDESDKFRLTTVLLPNGAVKRYSYTKDGLIKESVRTDGVLGVRNEFDDKNRVVHQTLADGSEYTYIYDDDKHVTTAIEPGGLTTEFVSDDYGRHIATRFPDLDVEEKYTYNELGKKSSYTDRRGFVTRYSYDNMGRISSVMGPEGLHEFYTYDADGKLSSFKNSEGNVTKYTYDLDGNLYSVTNPMGNKVKYDYEAGRIVSIRDAKGQRTSLTYDERGNIASVTDPSGVVTRYECDSLGRVIATIDADGNRTSYEIDAADNITRVVDPEGNVTSYKYNTLGKLSEVINPDGTRRNWEYNSIGKPETFTDEEMRVTKIFYNSLAKEERIVLPNNGNIKYEYDLLGNVSMITDADGRQSAYTRDVLGNVLEINKSWEGDEEETFVEAYEYDGLGRVVAKTDGNGNTTSFKYDKNGNVIKETDALGGEILREYDQVGRLVKETDPLNRVTSFEYDSNGNLVATTDPYGVVTENTYENNRLVKITKKTLEESVVTCTYEYDNCGRVKSETYADGFTVYYSYTKAGRIGEIKDSNERVKSFDYDACGRVKSVNDAGKITSYTYTGTGKIKSVTDAMGNRTEYEYNELDLLSKVTRFGDGVEADEHVTVYEHSLAGDTVAITDALGNKDVYDYDELDNVVSHIDRDNGKTIFIRDNNGNITGIDYSDGEKVRLSYNALNVLEEVKDKLGLTKIKSDIIGRTTSVTDYSGRTVSYEYGPYDQESLVSYPGGKKVEYSYDAFGRLISISEDSASDKVGYSYDEAGRLMSKTFPNGIRTTFGYYKGGLLKSLSSADGQGVLDEYVYKYNAASSVTDIERYRRGLDKISGVYHYEYDNLGRLTKSSRDGEMLASYEYDAFGNRTQMKEAQTQTTYQYDKLDRMLTSVTRNASGEEFFNSYSYDNRGNQVAVTSGDVLKKTFTFNVMGKMVKATDSELGEATYNYNGLGFIVESTRPDEKIEYLNDISRDYFNLIERSVNGETESFVYDDNVVSMDKGGESYYYILDELGSAMYLTGTDGHAVNTYAYDDFGRNVDPATGNTEKCTRNRNVFQPFTFTGYTEDAVTGFKFAQARFYDAKTGRFNAEDKVRGYVDKPYTFNHYNYCFNNPVEFVDNDGNYPDPNMVRKMAEELLNANRSSAANAHDAVVSSSSAVVAQKAARDAADPVAGEEGADNMDFGSNNGFASERSSDVLEGGRDAGFRHNAASEGNIGFSGGTCPGTGTGSSSIAGSSSAAAPSNAGHASHGSHSGALSKAHNSGNSIFGRGAKGKGRDILGWKNRLSYLSNTKFDTEEKKSGYGRTTGSAAASIPAATEAAKGAGAGLDRSRDYLRSC